MERKEVKRVNQANTVIMNFEPCKEDWDTLKGDVKSIKDLLEGTKTTKGFVTDIKSRLSRLEIIVFAIIFFLIGLIAADVETLISIFT